MNTIPFPEISPNFTVEDIRRIRTWNSARYASMTREEIVEDIRLGAKEFEAIIENKRQSKKSAI